jgi:anaerobic magnesium-protoporphyrin IX monomethyl ester cyclase
LKVLLVAVYADSKAEAMEEIGISFIASYLRKYGHEVEILGSSLSNVNYSHIVEFAPNLIGVTIYHFTKNVVLKFCERVNKILPETTLCAGGYFPTYNDDILMKDFPMVSFALRGEGEGVFLDLVNALEEDRDFSNIKGLTYRCGNDYIRNEDRKEMVDIDTIPSPDRTILNERKLKIALVSTSRGCGGNCSFCVNNSFWHKWRGKSVENVIDELSDLVAAGHKNFNFIDCSFEDIDRKCTRMDALVQGIIDMKADISYYIDIRAELCRKVTPEMIQRLKKSGLAGVLVGIETANEFDNKLYHKIATVQDKHDVVDLFQKYDIDVNIGFINFNPYSTIEGLKSNIEYLHKYGFACNFETFKNRLMVFKGCALYQKIVDDGLLIHDNSLAPYNYVYINKDIEALALFMNEYLDEWNRENSLIDRVYFYTDYFNMIIRNNKQIFERMNSEEAIQIVDQCMKSIKRILNELNDRNYKWVNQLIDVAANGWNHDKAIEIMNNNMTEEMINSIINRLDDQQYEYMNQIIDLGERFEEVVLNQ